MFIATALAEMGTSFVRSGIAPDAGQYSIAIRDKQGFINNLDPLHIVSATELLRRNGGS